MSASRGHGRHHAAFVRNRDCGAPPGWRAHQRRLRLPSRHFIVALQDLRTGKQTQITRLPKLAKHCSDPQLRAALETQVVLVTTQAARIAAAINVTGPENLWISGILNDTERDMRQPQFGRLFAIALIGAIRKAKAAEIVSSETVIGLARGLGNSALLNLAAADHAEEIATDRVLKARLTGLVLSPGSVPPAR